MKRCGSKRMTWNWDTEWKARPRGTVMTKVTLRKLSLLVQCPSGKLKWCMYVKVGLGYTKGEGK